MDRARFDAVLFDLDGVVTDTAQAHAEAWRRLFDEFLRDRTGGGGEDCRPFDPHFDYREYLDGMPRYDGTQRFLSSRGIDLPFGEPGDAPGTETVCGLANRKNAYFLAWLASNPVTTFPSTIALIRKLRQAALKTAVFSSSRNAAAVLSSAGIRDLFDARIDGTDLDKLGIPGKPDPAMILEAARRLGVAPGRAVVVEDAVAGVEAGAAGGFAVVIGIDRDRYGDELAARGADFVVRDLAELGFDRGTGFSVKMLSTLPSVWQDMEKIGKRVRESGLAVFLDYDGTLTPIVEDYRKAFLPDSMREAVGILADRCPVTIVSGRDVAVLRDLVKLPSVIYAGSHGFEVSAAGRLTGNVDIGDAYLPELDAAEAELRDGLRAVAGHAVERKRFAIAVHYRQVRDADVGKAEAVVDAVVDKHRRLSKGHGKKVFRVQPRVDWNKGRAVLWILERLDRRHAGAVPVCLGDDLTDEDAFRVVSGRGIGIAVGDDPRPTAADYALASTDEVERFLRVLAELAGGAGR